MENDPEVLHEAENSPEIEIQGGMLSALDHFWLDTIRHETANSITAIETSAKQIISLVTLLQGVFFAIAGFSSIKDKFQSLTGRNDFWLLLIVMITPIICWLISLWLSILVFLPKTYLVNLNSPDLSRDTFLEIVQYKHERLLQAYYALAIGFIPLIVTIIVLLAS